MKQSAIPLVLLALAAFGRTEDHPRPVLPLGSPEVTVEWMPGVEAVVRIAAESEDELGRFQVFSPDGRELIDLNARLLAQGGLSSVDLELREPSLEQLLENHVQGSYALRATTVHGSLALGEATLSFDLVAAPRIVHPRRGDSLPASTLTVVWLGDREAVGYEVQLEQGDDEGLRVKLPPEQCSFEVPFGLLAPGTETTVEVAAIAANGNRTIAESVFTTLP